MIRAGYALLFLGLLIGVIGFVMPVNDIAGVGDQIVGQDCDGPLGVFLVLMTSFIFTSAGLVLVLLKKPWRKSQVVILVFAVSISLLAWKSKEVLNEHLYNQSVEATCN